MDIASQSYEKTCDNLQVHGTAIVEREKERIGKKTSE